jgi:hypothetical protein
MTVSQALRILRRAYRLRVDFDHAVYARVKARYPEIARGVAVAWWGD